MRKIWLVIRREYVTRVHSKGFVIATFAFPLLFLGIFAFSAIVATRQSTRTLKIAIIDDVGGLGTWIAGGLNQKLPNGNPEVEVVHIYDQPQQEREIRRDLADQVRRGKLDGFLAVPKGALEREPAEFHIRNTGDVHLSLVIGHAVTQAIIERRLSSQGVKMGNAAGLLREVGLDLVKVTKEGESEEKGQTIVIAVVVSMALYMTLLIYGVATMRSVLEEKTTRMVEILVSSLTPFQLLMGKILGIAGVSLTQYLIWSASASLLAAFGGGAAALMHLGSLGFKIQLPFSLLVYIFVFFLGGYLVFASLFAAVGALVSNEQDMQQAQTPVTVLIVTPIILFGFIMRNPSSTLAVVLSEFPFFAPILMPLRIALQSPPFWQIALAIALLALCTVFTVQLSAKVYRTGILMYGKRPSLVEIFRWLRYT